MLGAFLAGLVLAETEFRHEVEVTIEPFKGLLLGLFFMAVGMSMDVTVLRELPVAIPLLVLALIAVKAAVLFAIFRAGGFGAPSAAADRDKRVDITEVTIAPRSGHVIIAGFGRVGQLLAQVLTNQQVPFIALETDPTLAARFHGQGLPVFFGNAARAELLRKLNASEARAIVLTMDHPTSALNAVNAIRRDFPHVQLLARSRDERHALALKEAGANVVIPETLEASLQLSAFVLQTLDVPDAVKIIQDERERRIAALSVDVRT